MNIFLIGYRCTGKTSVGRRVAQQLGWKFIDMDVLLTETSGETISEIVSRGGWPLFRKMEKQVLETICNGENQVIATGGGVVVDKENIDLMKRSGILFWLRATPETILKRMTEDVQTKKMRPSLTDRKLKDEIEETLKERYPLYRTAMTADFDTEEKTMQEVSEEIIRRLKHMG